ncbi:preprotein translocase subunit TatA [Salarchaeum sp. JOR-1]|uniref:preprotein translocase subunit TatA n=1 Tax=Salarchaeum sp. JOR-1 TaxID=2599399 RepID=UPI0011986EF0|nr:preprotein translocase subunit TatA [Salarchaeum sp. JOR-1]QDX39722.1 preprotein translocase subunit TatA [Salarchaeum sp. JOR-1]
MTALPAFVDGLPGGMELAIALVVFLVLMVVPFALLVAGGWYLLTRTSNDDERIADLEAEVAELKQRLDEEDDR